MSAGFDLAVIGALLQLCFSSSSSSLLLSCCMILCCFKQSLNLVFPSVSMRFRPKRTCSGVKCFGAFHIKRFSSFILLLFRRGGFT
ncbi:hypothetical protein SDJN02_21817 [Cucurbita argyrosperma subsp. argyrosperma]